MFARSPLACIPALIAGLATAASLAFAGIAAAQDPPPVDLSVIEQGKGWQRVLAFQPGSSVPGEKGGPPPTPIADMLVVTPDGIEGTPLTREEKDELYEDFGLVPPGGGGGEIEIDLPVYDKGKNAFSHGERGGSCQPGGGGGGGGQGPGRIVIDFNFVHALRDGGELPAEYLALANQNTAGDLSPEESDPERSGCFGWSNGSKTKEWSFLDNTIDQEFPLGNGFTGSLSLTLPYQSTGSAAMEYRVKKAACIPYKFKFERFKIAGDAGFAGDAELSATASLAYAYTKEFPLGNKKLGDFFFTVGLIPVWGDFHLPVTLGVDLNAQVSGTVTQDLDFGGSGSFDYTCDDGDCCGTAEFTDTFDSDGLDAAVEAKLTAEANVKVKVRARIWDLDFPWVPQFLRDKALAYAEAGVKGYVRAELWGYYGSTCGDADGNGQPETVSGLLADAYAGASIVYSLTGAAVPGPIDTGETDKEIELIKVNLGFWDLLGTSSVLTPMVSGPATAVIGEEVPYVVKMRPCFPYGGQVNLEVEGGGWTGPMTIANTGSAFPSQNSTTIKRTYTTAGPQTVKVKALSDDSGRDFNAHTTRTLQITNPVQHQPVSGLWENAAGTRSLDIYVNGTNDHTFFLYTQGTWYITDTKKIVNNVFTADLYRSTYTYDGTGVTNGYKTITTVGTVKLTFTANNTATFVWTPTSGTPITESVNLVHGGGTQTGMYYPNGWDGLGLMLKQQNGTTIAHFAYYDGAGEPILASGSTAASGPNNLFYLFDEGPNPQYAGSVEVTPWVNGNYLADIYLPGFTLNDTILYLLAY